MQKVSKQSLAMIALSILLAISIALTMTFAALSANRTATGSITFSGNVSITYNDLAQDGTFNLQPNYGDSNFTIPDTGAEFKISGDKNAYVRVTVTLTDASVVVKLKNLTIGSASDVVPTEKTLNGTTTSATYTTTTAVNTSGAGVTFAIDDIIESITFASAGDLTDGQISVKVEAQTNAQF